MKRFFALFTALVSIASFGTTTTPVQLLNPSGSTAGQAIVSNGPNTAPTWQNVSFATLSGVVPVSNGGTGATSAASARTNLGAAGLTTANTWNGTNDFTGSSAVSVPTVGVVANSTTAASTAWVRLLLSSPGTIGNTAPNTGSFTTLSASGLITPSSTIGIKGTATNDSAQAGSVGEFPTPTNLTGVSLTNNTAVNTSSISLTAGDYEVSGVVQFTAGGSTVLSTQIAGISTTSATLGALGSYTQFTTGNTVQAGTGSVIPTPAVRISVASTTTVYLIALGLFTGGTTTASGILHVRRVR